ncbi:MAG: ABC transporter substrate-binding protein [Desulfobacterales bacterium]|nr:ABC transporter substrate-binding protein [Desulfobacterales bacterium]
MRRLSRRKFLVESGIAAASAALGCAAFPGVSLASKEPELRLGYLPITDSAPLLVAHGLGYFKEEGIRMKRPLRVRSWSALMESFLTGKFNLTHMLLPMPVWMRFKNRVPIKVLAWNHTNGSTLTVGGHSALREFADLGGHHIAVPHWYSVHNVMLQMAIRHHGLIPVIQPQSKPLAPNEVNIFVLPPPEMPAALVGRKVDGFIVAEPMGAISEIKTGARIMRFTGDMWKNHPCCVVVMPEKITQFHPAFSQRVINAVVRAQLWITENREKAAHLLSRDGMGYLPMDQEVLKQAFLAYDPLVYGPSGALRHPEWQMDRIGFQPWPYPSATRLLVRELANTRVEGDLAFLKGLSPEFAARDLVDDRFVRCAMEALGGTGKFMYGELGDNPFERQEVLSIG